MLTATGALALVVRHQRAGGALTAAVAIGQVRADAHRRPVGIAVDVQKAAERLQRQIRGRKLAYGPVWPNGVIEVRMTRGLISASAAYPRPRPSR